ncbi:MAG: PhoH family protein [Deltaproteobacteria bacterium]|nr:PhoH family protein [Deltaproteobacteria bacterium]
MSDSNQDPGNVGLANATQVSERLAFEDHLLQLFGPSGRHLKAIEQELAITINHRGNEVTLVGPREQVALGRRLLEQSHQLIARGRDLDSEDVIRAARALKRDGNVDLRAIFSDTVLVTSSGSLTPKGPGQKRYVDAIRKCDVVFGIGPAGTGKTYLAMAMAVAALQQRQVKRIILTRPAVEAGERLGFLPGDLVEKVNPYLRPLYDALNDMLPFERVQNLMDRGQIEVAPLAFMRGRTLNGSFVILDEAQNATTDQMFMFLTRLGFDSKAVVTGDVTQSDLPSQTRSGLNEAEAILGHVKDIAFCRFDEGDVVRHPLVQKIIVAFDRYKRGQQSDRNGNGGDRGGSGA